jgi:hypothetical protein
MPETGRWIAQVLVYAGLAAGLGYFSASPSYTRLDPGLGVIKLSFSHAGEPGTECRRLTQEQLNRLAPNMRKAVDCPRQRVSLLVELELDGELLYRASLAPSGLAGDGASTVYRAFPVEAGRHTLAARLRDSRREQGFDWTMEKEVEISPGQNMVIDFQGETGGFKIL